MMFRVLLIFSLLFAASAAVCAQGQATNPAPPAEEQPPVLAVPKDYRYNARERRDPFVNPVPKPKAAEAPPTPTVVRPPGLKGVLVNEAQVAGVVTSKEPSMNVVIVSAPGVRTPYFARVGDQLFDGIVKSISFDTVTFLVTGVSGNAKTQREVVRQVRPKAGENR
jgi:hypothetical protein